MIRMADYESEIYRLSKSLEISKENNRSIKRIYSEKLFYMQKKLLDLDSSLKIDVAFPAGRVSSDAHKI